MSDDKKPSVADELRRAAQQATEASQKEADPVESALTMENVAEQASEMVGVAKDGFMSLMNPALTWSKKKADEYFDEYYESSKWFKRSYDFCDVSWNYGLKQLFWFVTLPARKIISPLHDWAFPYVAFGVDEETGERTKYNRFRYTAARWTLGASAIGGALVSCNMMMKIPVYTTGLAWDASMMTVFGREEKAIVGQPSERLHTWYGSEFVRVSVCPEPCDSETDNTTYIIVENSVLTAQAIIDNLLKNPWAFAGIGELKLRTIEEIADEAIADTNRCTLSVFGTRNDFWGREPKIYDMDCTPVAAGVDGGSLIKPKQP